MAILLGIGKAEGLTIRERMDDSQGEGVACDVGFRQW